MSAQERFRSFQTADGFYRIPRFLFKYLPLAIAAIAWEFLALFVIPGGLLPPASAVAVALVDYLVTGDIWPHLMVSIYRVALGLAAGVVGGITLGVGMARIEAVEKFFDVFVTMTYPIPKTALVPLAILWFGIGTLTSTFVIFLGTLIPVVLNSYNGAKSVDEKLVWSARMMGTSERDVLRRVILPAAMPRILTGIQQAIPLAFIVLIAAELIASRQGIGNLISRTGQFGLYARMLAVVIIFSFVALVADRIYRRIRRRILVWT